MFLRVGDDFSHVPPDPQNARPILEKYPKLDEQGDGVRCFVGIVAALLGCGRSLVLIDEPEAFLHPPQAFRIGQFLSDESGDDRQIIIATHSADVLRGIMTRNNEVSVVRFDRIGNRGFFRVLDPQRIREIVNDPLLSSARVLDGLFYSGAVVVESDSDARLYQSALKKQNPNSDLHFVNADNKQTVPKVAQMYRDLGVRCVGIVDFDVLNDRTEFQKQLEALNVDTGQMTEAMSIRDMIGLVAKEPSPESKIADIQAEITAISNELTKIQSQSFGSNDEALSVQGKFLRGFENRARNLMMQEKIGKQLKREGCAALPPQHRLEFERLWSICAEKGLFINPTGELESTLVDLGVPYTTDKRSWILQALQLISHLEPSDQKQLWKFLKRIQEFFDMR